MSTSHDIPIDTSLTAAKMLALEERLRALGSVMVAYSGGVDSAFLAATAHKVLGDRMLAVLADSPSLARPRYGAGQGLRRDRHVTFLSASSRQKNWTSSSISATTQTAASTARPSCLKVCVEAGRRTRLCNIAYGMNADDRRDYRPGQRAAEQHEVLAPLAEVGLAKLEIRALAKEAGYTLWDRPGCALSWSSRVEYGRPVTREVLEQVERAEESLRQLGFREFRVRHHGELARVEVARAELSRALNLDMMDRISAELRSAGFQYVTLDCTGFRSGSLNAVLPAEVLMRRGT